MTLFGVPFLAAGLFLMLAGAGIVPLETGRPPSMRLGFLAFGLPFVLVGGGLVFGRSWTTLSATDRTVVKQMGLLVPMRSTSYRVDEYNGVLLDFIRGDSDTADQYPVSLRARAGGNLRLFSSTTYSEARQRAAAIAALFHFEIEDSSTAHPVRMTAAEADMSFQHRRRLEHQRDEPIARPASMQSDVRDDGGSVTIVIPARRWHSAAYLFFLLPIAVPVFLVGPFSQFFRQTRTPDVVSLVFLAFLIGAFGLLPAYSAMSAFLKSRRGRTTVTVSSAGVRLDERRVWKTRTLASFPASDILDVDYSAAGTLAEMQIRRSSMAAPPVGKGTELVLNAMRKLSSNGGVTIKTRQGMTTFGDGLDDSEVRYLHYLVRRTLVQ